MPGVKADHKIEALYRTSAPWPRLFEAVPALALALVVFWKTRSFSLVWPSYAYIGYLLLDLLLVPQRRLTKWIRNGSAAVFMVGYAGFALAPLGLPAPIGRAALAALLAGAGSPYLYDRGRVALGFVHGLVLSTLLAIGAQYLAATALGPHVALPLFCAAYAWDQRSVFWRYAAPILAAYGVLVPLWLGGGVELLPHAIAGLVAWGLARLCREARARGRRPTRTSRPRRRRHSAFATDARAGRGRAFGHTERSLHLQCWFIEWCSRLNERKHYFEEEAHVPERCDRRARGAFAPLFPRVAGAPRPRSRSRRRRQPPLRPRHPPRASCRSSHPAWSAIPRRRLSTGCA